MYFNLPCVNFIRCPRAFQQMITSADHLLKRNILDNNHFNQVVVSSGLSEKKGLGGVLSLAAS